ncbi:neurogenic locus notch homolog protein 1-like isoform X1 [Mya arenaria]|uniref:neurogenic locus notch homolog protein 1-like isoform X1 n=2 Tax=Mya arenaria TaxID=6604 RepID=UPI0022E85DF7|nr:neurogenic locus notch homolog protein 1-like isoform X1 [Mya arenaria]
MKEGLFQVNRPHHLLILIMILHGRQILAEMECTDYYEGYYLDYEDADGEVTSPPTRLLSTIVNCTEGVISDYTLDCDDVETSDIPVTIPEECKTVPNGEVTDNGQSFQCNEDYVHADSLLYERYSCSCDRTIPALVCNGRQAKCKPINCKLNSFIEQGMTLKYRSKFITASTIDAIDHGESVMLNCETGANGVTYEPKRRMFKSDRGKWFEDNRRGSVWSLGNNGTFPKCRPAKCECQNGGTCIRDETCKCSRFTKGLQCETPLCPGQCQNGGTCISPNRCSCPYGFSGSRCEKARCDDGCQNGGTCTSPNKCSCPNGFSGSRCESARCDGGCQNGGTCTSPNKCSCADGFSGSRCESALCDGGCQNGGTCTSPNRCSCPKGFSASRCETALCDRGCQNGGTCTSPNRRNCPKGFSGSHCETGKSLCNCSNKYS